MNVATNIIQDIMRILSVRSFTGDLQGITDCMNEYKKIALNLGFLVRSCANGKVLIVEPQNFSGFPELGIVVHLDTVPFTKDSWHHNPLGEISDGRIYGRGVIDDKAAAVIALYACAELENHISNSWQIIVGTDEEGNWSDMDEYLKENPVLPKFSFTIDGDGVQHGCRGYADLNIVFYRCPTKSNSTNYLSQLKVIDPVSNMVPELATAKYGKNSLTQYGRATHTSTPELGVNALSMLVRNLAKKAGITDQFSSFFQMMSDIEDVEKVTSLSEKETSFEGSTTTLIPTACNISGDLLTLMVNVRLSPNMTSSTLSQMLKKINLKYDCTCHILDFKLPAYIDPNSRYIEKMLESYKEVLGKETTSILAAGTGYNSAIPNCAIFGPRFAIADDEPDLCHSVDENRSINDLMVFKKMLEVYLKKIIPN